MVGWVKTMLSGKVAGYGELMLTGEAVFAGDCEWGGWFWEGISGMPWLTEDFSSLIFGEDVVHLPVHMPG